ncbi:MAG: YihY/virulence factor BrkB family protein [Actinomycetota bacterium]
MSTATYVPPTFDLEGDGARKTLRSTGRARLFKDAFKRFRAADGFSHSRALAYQIFLSATAGLIGMVALATAAEERDTRRVLEETLKGMAPGPTGKVLTDTFQQGAQQSGSTALWLGLGVAVLAGALAMAQIERGANRIYGIDEDRPTLKRYGLAAILAVTAGLLIFASVLLLVAGSAIAQAGLAAGGWSDALATAWEWLRWPAGVALIILSTSVLFRYAPRRHQPSMSWLASGAVLSVVLWLVFTAGLSLYTTAAGNFGDTYGPLAGIIGLLLWANLTSISMHLGLAFSAQLEAVRAGVSKPSREADPMERHGLGSSSESLSAQDDRVQASSARSASNTPGPAHTKP